ncbi:uncharacterized protein LOC107418172 [Ziziphus jujuba]|uniref:Uncharacterized protein LOC107418172 n=2 Tax=Ziziphus jujuba TaxID=326968 RepID=A0A6P3ZNV9_ZIZJJ|nr:uncharacterized protein LOC107418172 [Ziziphus jujuba]KAH7528265.1 hypothetical protein FEM48_Zijuj05G0054100 [Ziziphus jujuba var. spinosa]
MDGRGGCCIARYAGGGAYDMSKVDRIMLRFRPIAPKPATSGSVSGGSTPEISEHSVKGGRGKRKYVRDHGNNNRRCNNNNNRKRKSSPEEKRVSSVATAVEPMVTLPLLPETPEPKDSPARVSPEVRDSPMWLSFDKLDNNNIELGIYGSSDRTVAIPRPVRLLGSCITVECVTDTWMDGNGLGCTDEERKMNLEKDSCPGFISDGFGRVTWTNRAYRKMVGHGEEGGEEEMMVWLVSKERVPVAVTLTYPAFTCRVRLQYMYGGKEKTSLTLPCDVWRMNGSGGFAWRLDVKAALCLGR